MTADSNAKAARFHAQFDADVGSTVDRCARCNAQLQFDTDGMGGLVPMCPKHGRNCGAPAPANGEHSRKEGGNVVDVAALPSFLKRYRESKSVTYTAIGELAGVTGQTIANIERGNRPTPRTRSALEQGLGIRIVGDGEVPEVKLEPKPRTAIAKALVLMPDPVPVVATVTIIEPTPHRDAFLHELRAKRDRIDLLIAEIEAVA